MSRKIVIDPLTRVEGHGKVTIRMDDDHRVTDTRLHIVEFRGFERFVQYWHMYAYVQQPAGAFAIAGEHGRSSQSRAVAPAITAQSSS